MGGKGLMILLATGWVCIYSVLLYKKGWNRWY